MDRVVLTNGGNDETVLDRIVVVEVVTASPAFVCSVGGVIRGLGEASG